jgi:putative transposase
MTRKNSNRTTAEIKALMAEDGEFLRPIVRTVIQEFLEAEMSEAIGAQKGERKPLRLPNGYYPRSLIKLELRVPQDRNGRFSTDIFERYQRSEKALVAALTQAPCPKVS